MDLLTQSETFPLIEQLPTVLERVPSPILKTRSSMNDVPVIDVKVFLERLPGWETECQKVKESLHNYGILIFKDPRAN